MIAEKLSFDFGVYKKAIMKSYKKRRLPNKKQESLICTLNFYSQSRESTNNNEPQSSDSS